MNDDAAHESYALGWSQGVADAGARLVGVVAAALGQDHPVIARMIERLGSLTPPSGRQYVGTLDTAYLLHGDRPVADVALPEPGDGG